MNPVALLSILPVLFWYLIAKFIQIRNRYLPTRDNRYVVLDDNKLCIFWNENKSLFYILLVIDIIILIIILVYLIYFISEIDPENDYIPILSWVVATALFLYPCGYLPWKACKNVQMKASTPNGESPDDEEDTY